MDRLALLAGLFAALSIGQAAKPALSAAEAPDARAAAFSCPATPCADHTGERP